ncbi:MAG: ribonuclease E/G, partial [Sphingomonas sp.]
RDMAGLVVIDFIDMDHGSNVRKVEKAMKEALKNDRARIQVGRISAFGLMEMSRQRLRTGVLEASTRQCPHCEGTGLVRTASSAGLSALRMIEDEAARGRGSLLLLRASQEAALYVLNRKRAELAEIEERYGVRVEVASDGELEGARMTVEAGGPPPVHAPRIPMLIEEPEDDFEEEIDEEEIEEEAAEEEERPRRGRDRERQPRAEAEGETDGEGRKRRRRRRGRRSGRRDEEGAPQSEGEVREDQDEGDEGEDSDAPREGETAEATEARVEANRKRRRRGRRGGRGGRGNREGGEREAGAEGEAEPVSEVEAETPAEPEAPVKKSRSRKKAVEAEAPVEAPVVEAAPEPEPEAAPAKKPRSRKKAVEAEAPAAIEQDLVAEDAAAEAEAGEDGEPSGPRRGGWWQRTFGQ